MTKIAILGAGQIGMAVYNIINSFRTDSSEHSVFVNAELVIIDNLGSELPGSIKCDMSAMDSDDLSKLLIFNNVNYVINALPFYLNKKVSTAALMADCSYIDFTEDDISADYTNTLYKDFGKNLTCATKCGLAPGFINYIGYNLANKIPNPQSLVVSVGALPRSVSYDRQHPEHSYNLTWSVDGLVNEYIRPCRVKVDGISVSVEPLNNRSTVVLDGIEYEADYTSGGVGSLVTDLTNVPNVHYMTLRYPGHYDYVKGVIISHGANFDEIRKVFVNKFPTTDDDVIIVYVNAMGNDINGLPVRRSYFNKFYGTHGLTGIQATTAGSGVAILELILESKLAGIIMHSDVSMSDFASTLAFRHFYNTTQVSLI
jgi:saccharopine dehydrogenase-like NADP-dependent oxidoreductase